VKAEINLAKDKLDKAITAAQTKANSAYTYADDNNKLLAKKTEITLNDVEAKVNAAKKALIEGEIDDVKTLATTAKGIALANKKILLAKADLTKVQELVKAKADTATVDQIFTDIKDLNIPALKTKLNNLQTAVDGADAASVTAGFKGIADWFETINPCGAGLQLKDSNDASKGCEPCQAGHVCPAIGTKYKHKECNAADQWMTAAGTALKDAECSACTACAPGWSTSSTCNKSNGSYQCKQNQCKWVDKFSCWSWWDCKGWYSEKECSDVTKSSLLI